MTKLDKDPPRRKVLRFKSLRPSAVWCAAVLLTLVTFSVVPRAWAQNVAGSISSLSGSATITRSGATIRAAQGVTVQVGDRLITGPGSNLTVTLSDGSQVELTDSSTLTIDENTLGANHARASTKMSLLGGLARSLVRTTPGTPPNYEIHTPNAVAAVRGTDFEVGYETGVQDKKFPGCAEFSRVSVNEGVVEVYNPKNPGSPKVQVKKGQKVTVPCAGAVVAAGLGSTIGGIGAGTVAAGAVGLGGIAVGAVAGAGGLGGGGSSSNAGPPVSASQ